MRVIVNGAMGEAKTILVVDDGEAITGALTVLFDQAGYRVLVAHSGAEGLALLQEQPDLIILDICQLSPLTGSPAI